MEEKFYEMTKDLPQLILAMDTNDGNGQYVLIQNAKEDETYYCPCCGGEVKPRAYKKDKEYQVQPHFYHINGGCTEESYIHYVCKMLLTKKNCKFKVGDKEYSVKSVDVEKTYDTKFGKYRPDVTIVTKEDKVFFAEIAHTSQKTQEYLPKWDELGNDVIEIKSNEFINVIVENKIPSFKLIYSNGQCFVKSSLHEDYTKFIYKRKEDWKRQDLLNYKIQWERLDWFFIKLQDYKLGKTSYESMLDSFKQVDRVDKPLLFDLIKKQSCLKDERQQFRDVINNEMDKYFQEKVYEYKNKGIVIIGKLEPRNSNNILSIYYNGFRSYVSGGTRSWINDIPTIDKILNLIDNEIIKINKNFPKNKINPFISEVIMELVEKYQKYNNLIFNNIGGTNIEIKYYIDYGISRNNVEIIKTNDYKDKEECLIASINKVNYLLNKNNIISKFIEIVESIELNNWRFSVENDYDYGNGRCFYNGTYINVRFYYRDKKDCNRASYLEKYNINTILWEKYYNISKEDFVKYIYELLSLYMKDLIKKNRVNNKEYYKWLE